jgi:hypothetical protein
VAVEVMLGLAIRFRRRKRNGKKYCTVDTAIRIAIDREAMGTKMERKRYNVKAYINKYKYRIENKKKSGHYKRGR